MNTPTAQDVWQDVYGANRQLNCYPWDVVVSFVYREVARRGLSVGDLRVLEVGCGGGCNLWFAAREGAAVCGTDLSEHALSFAKERFEREGLDGRFDLAQLPELPDYGDAKFDLIIDRACLTHCSPKVMQQTLDQLRCLIHPDGRLLSTVYGTRSSSCRSGQIESDGRTGQITAAPLTGVGPIAFYDDQALRNMFGGRWRVESLTCRHDLQTSGKQEILLEQWQIVASACG